MSRPVVVVGDLGIDVLVVPGAPPAPGGDTPSRVIQSLGGAGGNAASWLAAYGMPVALVARVGDDLAGRHARDELERRGVACVLTVDASLPTCTVVSLVGAGGERTMLSDRGAAGALAAGDVDLGAAVASLRSPPTGMPHLHLSGFVLLNDGSRAAGLHALSDARLRGWSTSVDPQAANLVAGVGPSTFLDWVGGVDLLLSNKDEAMALGGVDVILEAVSEVVVTRGRDGAEWLTRNARWAAPAPIVDAVDTTGCGDAFNAGLLTGWLGGGVREASLSQGVEAGAAAATRVGAGPPP